MDKSALARVEAQRAELEANVTKLRKSLRHWQALETDYQGLSEEFVARPEILSKDEALKIARDYKPEVVDEKELRELLSYDKATSRRPEQVIELLSKRVEYVNRNVDTIKKQLSDAQKKLNALLLAEQPEFRDEAGLPLTDITEELDEEGKVVASKLQRSDQAAPQLAQVLKKAGVRDVEDIDGKVVAKELKGQNDDVASLSPVSARISTDNPRDKLLVGPDHRTATKDTALATQSASGTGDSAEEAALRAEMLEYHDGLGEVGAIVAELDLEEGDVSYGEDEDDDLSVDSDYDEDEDLENESEDETGMSRSSLHSEAYLRKMKLLEKKHGITGMSNLGPKPDLPAEVKGQIDRPPPAEAARKAALARAEAAAKSETTAETAEDQPGRSKAKKKVAFAKTLDIAKDIEPRNLKPEIEAKVPVTVTARPLKDSIVERPAKRIVDDSAPIPAKKVYRFKAARNETPQTRMFAPGKSTEAGSTTEADSRLDPVGKIYEPKIVEHPSSTKDDARPPGGDDFGIDDAMHQREIATEYHQMRNRMIQRQGGFVNEGEQNNWGDATAPLPVEDETGKLKKVSRFKAARMK